MSRITPIVRWMGPAAALAVAASVAAQDASIIYLVDFEDLPEETEISAQYEEFGVTFSIEGDPDLLPIIAVEGAPIVAFFGSGNDAPMPSLSGGLADPIIDGDPFAPSNIVMTFDPPVTSVRLFVVDLDGSETITLRAFDGAREVAADTHTAGQPGTGNGVSTLFFVAGDSITSAVLDTGTQTAVGVAMDYLTFTRPCIGNACGPRVRVSQESAPGADDFADNVLGEILIYPFAASAAGFYAYNVPDSASWNGQAVDMVTNRSHVFVGDSTDGITLYIVHDRANDGAGGEAETMVEILGDADGARRSVEDDPVPTDPPYGGEPGDSVFTANQGWDACCTDGYAISGLDCQWSALVQFTDVDGNPGNPTIAGLVEWYAYSATGDTIELALEADRRVLLEFVPGGSCPPDLNYDNVVGVTDLLAILAEWGPCDPACSLCRPDLDDSGFVDVGDLLIVLAQWGECPR